MSNIKVLIVGASIAGPMTAYWLAKTGANITIIERYPEFRKGGQNIDIRTTGVTVMSKVPGMEANVRAKCSTMEGISFVDERGRSIAEMKPTGDPNQQSLVSEYEIFRDDLSEILYDYTKDTANIKYIFGEQVASMQPDEKGDGPITVTFANGFPTSQYDLVIACDGSTSRTRAIGFECGVRDHITPVGMWAAYFSVDGDLLDGRKVGQLYNKPGGRGVGIGPDPRGVTRVDAYGLHPIDSEDMKAYRKAKDEGEEASKKFVAKHFEGCGWKCDEIFKHMEQTADFYTSEVVQVKVPNLYIGRFVLVGDAGYAPGPTGTGTSLAMTGAYVLAGEIAASKGNIAAALQNYEERMKPIIKDMQKIPPGVPGIMAPQTAWALALRNTVFKVVAWGMKFGKYFSWITALFASGFGSDKANLPEYDFKEW